MQAATVCLSIPHFQQHLLLIHATTLSSQMPETQAPVAFTGRRPPMYLARDPPTMWVALSSFRARDYFNLMKAFLVPLKGLLVMVTISSDVVPSRRQLRSTSSTSVTSVVGSLYNISTDVVPNGKEHVLLGPGETLHLLQDMFLLIREGIQTVLSTVRIL